MAKKINVPPDKLALHERLLAAAGDLVGKSNIGSAHTAVNGNMYSMLSKHGVVGIRLTEPQRAEFIDKYQTTIFRADPDWPPARPPGEGCGQPPRGVEAVLCDCAIVHRVGTSTSVEKEEVHAAGPWRAGRKLGSRRDGD